MDTLELPVFMLLDGQLLRDIKFKAITGILERAISESGLGISSLSEQVTRILVNALDTVAGLPATEKLICALSSGDRQYLMLRLQAIIDPRPQWLTSACQECNEFIQFQLEPGALPVKPAGDQFPHTCVSLSIGDARIRVPTGADEEAIARDAVNDQSAMKLLLNRLISLPSQKADIDSLTCEDQQLIDQLLEKMSPQLSESVSITCPYCEHQQELPIDNYAWIIRESTSLDEEVHTLAFRYHWSEKEILSLGKTRRQHYIQLIEKNLGKYQDVEYNSEVQGGR